MKQKKLYNVANPIWLLFFFPPALLITLLGSFIIDSLVILACFFMFKLAATQNTLKMFYKEIIWRVWLFGFLSDMIADIMLGLIGTQGDLFGLPSEIKLAINYDPFSNPGSIIVLIFTILVSALCAFLFNYRVTFRNQIVEKKLRFKVALTIAIVTMPWPFWFPAVWFYQGL